jgi:hypothetical protein
MTIRRRSDPGVKTYRIYALTQPEIGEARYIGQTAGSIEQRYEEHMRYDARKASARAQWIRDLKAQGRSPNLRLLQKFTGTRKRAYAGEHNWIRKLHEEGHRLLNYPLPKRNDLDPGRPIAPLADVDVRNDRELRRKTRYPSTSTPTTITCADN